MIKVIRFGLIIISAFTFISNVNSQAVFERISTLNGLSNNTVISIIEDKKGFIWFGTDEGLNRFDGYSFKIYKRLPNNANGLSHNIIKALFEDSEGIIWIGTHGGGLISFNPLSENFTTYTNNPSDSNSISHNDITSIIEDGNYLWIDTDNGLDKFDVKKEKFTTYKSSPDNSNSLSDNNVCYNNKNLWIGTLGGGLNLFVKDSGIFRNYNEKDGLPNNMIKGILYDSRGHLWISTSNGLSEFDILKKTIPQFRYKRRIS
jgi:ligand-binding sensor domain-containing protein